MTDDPLDASDDIENPEHALRWTRQQLLLEAIGDLYAGLAEAPGVVEEMKSMLRWRAELFRAVAYYLPEAESFYRWRREIDGQS